MSLLRRLAVCLLADALSSGISPYQPFLHSLIVSLQSSYSLLTVSSQSPYSLLTVFLQSSYFPPLVDASVMIGASHALKDKLVKLQLQLFDAEDAAQQESRRADSFADKSQRLQVENQRLRRELWIAQTNSKRSSRLYVRAGEREETTREETTSPLGSSFTLVRSPKAGLSALLPDLEDEDALSSGPVSSTRARGSQDSNETRASIRRLRKQLSRRGRRSSLGVAGSDPSNGAFASPSRVNSMATFYARLHQGDRTGADSSPSGGSYHVQRSTSHHSQLTPLPGCNRAALELEPSSFV